MTDSKKIDDGGPAFSSHEEMIDAICNAVILGEDENDRPVYLEPREAEAALGAANVRWLPIDLADKTITDVQEFPEAGITIKTSDRYWVRDDDGRVYEAAWSEGRYGRDYWWDFEGESPVDPVGFMPHPLDPRYAARKGGAQ